MVRSKKSKMKLKKPKIKSMGLTARTGFLQKRSMSFPMASKKVLKRTTTKNNRCYSTGLSSIKKSQGWSRTQSFTKKMIHAPHVPKILVQTFDQRSCLPPKLKQPKYKKLWMMSLHNRLLWNQLLKGYTIPLMRSEIKPHLYLLTIEKSYGCKDKYKISPLPYQRYAAMMVM